MLLSQVLEPVVVEIAPEPDGPQDEDRPVLHPRTAAVGAADPIDILGDGIEQGITQGGPGVNVLQGCQDGDDLVSPGGVEPDVEDGCAVESQLGIEGDSHGRGPRRFPRSGAGNWLFRGNSYARSPILRGVVLSRIPEKTGSNTFCDGHSLGFKVHLRSNPEPIRFPAMTQDQIFITFSQ